MLLRLSVAAAPPLRSPPATRWPRTRVAPTPPSACAECVRKRALEERPQRKRKRKSSGEQPFIAFAAKPGFDVSDAENDADGGRTSTPSPSSPPDPGDTRPEDGPALRAALALLRFYRNSLSPLMPKSCRFLPTCSEFAQISYRRFGVVKGTVLTAWRLLRCNPLNPGRTFYDPPRWPPVGLEWAFGGGGDGGSGGGSGYEEDKKE